MRSLLTTITLSLVVALVLTGCTTEPTPEPVPTPEPEPTPTPEPVHTESVAAANNGFAMDIYRKCKSEEGNVFFSPYSISSALAMTYEGARGETAEEMRSTLHLPEDKEQVRTEFQDINAWLNRGSERYELKVANALWAQEDYEFHDAYFSIVEAYYGGAATNLDFAGKTEQSRKTINDWVEEQTNGRIQDLIPKGGLNAMTRMVLTNTVYFKANWTQQFSPLSTRDQDFTISDGTTITVDMMRQTSWYDYMENDDFQMLEMDYQGDDISMLVILPKDNDLDKVEGLMSSEHLASWKDDLERKEVRLSIPKFTFETKYFMAEQLQSMGMEKAFQPGVADFTGMSPTDELYISEVIHQTFIEVAENGTEAAAATAVVMEASSAMPDPDKEEPKVFTADHPFIFLIQEKETGNVLFMGRLSNPEEE